MAGLIRTCLCALALAVFALSIAPASAQSSKSPLGVPVPVQQAAPAPEAPSSAGPLTRMWSWIMATQSQLNRDMAAAVKGVKSEDPLRAAAILIAIAFAYGVLHAAGPGHGKAVISAYVLANKETVRRGIALSFLAALFQALSAILFVAIMALVLRQTSLQMRSTEATIETISWGLVAAVGAYLLWRQIKPYVTKAGGHGRHDNNMQVGGAQEQDHHDHGPHCGCGHAHMPMPGQLQGAWSWSRALPLALSVGIRPCSGAILLLIFALSQGMLWAGILGTFAMALGTAITVSVLAAMAVGSREWATRASGPESVWAERIQTAAGFTGAALVFGLGTAFFFASLSGPGPL